MHIFEVTKIFSHYSVHHLIFFPCFFQKYILIHFKLPVKKVYEFCFADRRFHVKFGFFSEKVTIFQECSAGNSSNSSTFFQNILIL